MCKWKNEVETDDDADVFGVFSENCILFFFLLFVSESFYL